MWTDTILSINVISTQVMQETQTKSKTKLSDSFGGTVEKDIPENVEWIDDAFYIK